MGKILRYSLKKDESTWFNTQGRSVFTQSSPAYIKCSPANWRSTKISFLRNIKYWGIFRENSTAMRFVRDAAAILREIRFGPDTFEGKCILVIEKWNTTFLRYEPFYEGDLNFITSNSQRNYFDIEVQDRGTIAQIKAKEDTVYELSLDDPDTITVRIDGPKVGANGTWYPGTYSATADNGFVTSQLLYTNTGSILSGRSVTLNTGSITQIAEFVRPHSQQGFIGNPVALVKQAFDPGNPSPDDGEYVFYANTALQNVTIDGSMAYSTITPDVVGVKTIRVIATVVNLALPSPSVVSQTVLHTFTTEAQDTEVGTTAIMQGTFDMPANTYLLITIVGYSPDLGGGDPFTYSIFFPIEGGFFKIKYLSQVAPTFAKGFRVIDVAKKLMAKISEDTATVQSAYLSNQDSSDEYRKSVWDSLAYNTILMPGDSVRGLPNPIIKLSHTQFYEYLFGHHCLALKVQGNLVSYEPLRSVFTDEIVVRLGPQDDVTVGLFTETIANNFKGGYNNYDVENVTGKNEFNTGNSRLQDSILRQKKEDDFTSPIRFDVYGIEQARAENFNEERKDYRSDNDIFGIEIAPEQVAGNWVPWRPAVSYIQGVDDPVGIYNLGVTPTRRYGMHLPRIKSQKATGNLVFQTTDKNPELVSDLYNVVAGPETIAETETIPLAPNMWKGRDTSPIHNADKIMMNAVTSRNLYYQLSANPYGLVEWEVNGVFFYGWLFDLGTVTATNEPYPVVLFSHPSNNLKLLKYA